MRILLDTQCWLWMSLAPERFSPRGRRIVEDTAHALAVASLPPHHRDPFDRLLVAQAQAEDLPILTADPAIGLYDVDTIAA